VLALGGGAVATAVAVRERGDAPAPPLHERSPDRGPAPAVVVHAAPAIPVVAPDAGLVVESPYVIVTIEGAPAVTDVSIAGRFVGSAPGPVQLPRGQDPVILVFKTEGYLSVSKTITPDRAQTLAVPMKKRARPSPPPGVHGDDSRGTLAEPFRK
jgi:hypothetical protein